jgi:hypothetical protein
MARTSKVPQELKELEGITEVKDMTISWSRGNYLEKMLEDIDALSYSKWS